MGLHLALQVEFECPECKSRIHTINVVKKNKIKISEPSHCRCGRLKKFILIDFKKVMIRGEEKK